MTDSGLTGVFLAQRDQLTRFLAVRLGNRDEAEDVIQDMWLRLARFPTGPVAEPKAYLFRMAANLATDRRVSAARRGARENAWLSVQPESAEFPDGEQQLVAKDELEHVERILEGMPERMRQALIMFRLEEKSQKLIAYNLGITVSGVEKLLRRGYRHLVERLHAPSADMADPCGLEDEGSALK